MANIDQQGGWDFSGRIWADALGFEMNASDLELIRQLASVNKQALLFFDEVAPVWADSWDLISKVVFRRPLSEIGKPKRTKYSFFDWRSEESWQKTSIDQIFGSDARTAVFDAHIDWIPTAAFGILEARNIESIFCLGEMGWEVFRLEKWAGLPASRILGAKRKIRDGLVRVLGKDLRNISGEYYHESGHCFRLEVPNLFRYADRPEHPKSQLMIFEDLVLLPRSHKSHSEIRNFGHGRYAHWETGIYFSSTDNSDPNRNGRTYRYLHLKGPLRLFHWIAKPPTLPRVLAERERKAGERFAELFIKETKERPVSTSTDRSIERDGVCLFTGHLGAGGAERQLCNLAVSLKSRGIPVRICTSQDNGAEDRHYSPLLHGSDIETHACSSPYEGLNSDRLIERKGLRDVALFSQMPAYLRNDAWNLYTYLVEKKPAVLHCWLDHPNIIGGIAGWIAGVPKILLSVRNVNPTHFPYLNQPWFLNWYRILSSCSSVSLSGNSELGTKDYARWIGIPAARFKVLRNGVDFKSVERPTQAKIDEMKADLGISPEDPVVSGVFRFSPEKRPALFLETVAQVKRHLPRLKVLLAGTGPLETEIRTQIDRLGLGDVVHLLGRRNDIPLVMSASDLVLLTSSEEGTPNVLMEAQYLERPVVATSVGGVPEVVRDGQTGFLYDKNDAIGLVQGCLKILTDSGRKHRMGDAGKRFIIENFSLDRTTEETIQLYRSS